MPKLDKKNILFLCTENAARSQMAEALLRHKANALFNVFSAGTHPDTVDPRAINALIKFGINADNLISKSISTFKDKTFDYVITLCDKANNECRGFPTTRKQLAWDFQDPKMRTGANPFSATLHELNNRLSMFLLGEQQSSNFDENTHSGDINETDCQLINLDPITFYKSLTDDIRLKTLMLTHYHGELCVCELMEAMKEDSQPKMSRNLAVLRKAQIITDRRHGQWVFYRINSELPMWAKSVIAQTTENNIPLIQSELQRLTNMQNRPDKSSFCK